ncbi:MAG: glutathione S-transferase N-terminal domain-containing protein [Pseudomonadota bacterium]
MAKRVITKLYSNPTSPFARKIHVFLREAAMIDQVEIETVAGHPTDSGSIPLEANPLGKLPIMVLDDGEFVYDSRIITLYIDSVAQMGLYPAVTSALRTHVLEAAADGIMDAAVLMVYEARSRAEDKIDPQWVEGQWARIDRKRRLITHWVTA